jgi:hypothetical protein
MTGVRVDDVLIDAEENALGRANGDAVFARRTGRIDSKDLAHSERT